VGRGRAGGRWRAQGRPRFPRTCTKRQRYPPIPGVRRRAPTASRAAPRAAPHGKHTIRLAGRTLESQAMTCVRATTVVQRGAGLSHGGAQVACPDRAGMLAPLGSSRPLGPARPIPWGCFWNHQL
jgi:hypothetical protein